MLNNNIIVLNRCNRKTSNPQENSSKLYQYTNVKLTFTLTMFTKWPAEHIPSPPPLASGVRHDAQLLGGEIYLHIANEKTFEQNPPTYI